MQLITVLKTKASIEGMTKAVLVSVEVETDDVDYTHWERDLMEATKLDMEAGRCQSLYVKVTARFTDLAHYEGADSLGQVIVRGSKLTKGSDGYADLRQTVREHDMVQNAIDALVKNVLNGVNDLNQFLGKVA